METRVKAINLSLSLSFFVYYRILLFENSIVIYESEIFLDIPVRARKVFCLGIIYRTKGIEGGGEGFASDRINAWKRGTCAFCHARCFIILWGEGERNYTRVSVSIE